MIRLKKDVMGRLEIVRGPRLYHGTKWRGSIYPRIAVVGDDASKPKRRHGKHARQGKYRKVVAKKIFRSPNGAVMGLVLSKQKSVNLSQPRAASWVVDVYNMVETPGGYSSQNVEKSFSANTPADAAKKANDFVKSRGWRLSASEAPAKL